MKKLLSALLSCSLVLAAWGQTFPGFQGLPSLENQKTAGLSVNEIDSSFKVDQGFGSVTNPFFLAGVVGNPGQIGNAAAGTNFSLGYYQPGSLPFSAYGSFSFTNRATAIPANTKVPSYNNTVNVASGSTTNAYLWSTTVTDTKYDLPSSLNALSGTAQGFAKFGAITAGLYLNFNPNWAATDFAAANAYYRDRTVSTQYNTAAGGAIPVEALDYTVETVTSNINAGALPAPGGTGIYATTSSLSFAVPLAMKTGNLEHAAQIYLNLYGSDQSGKYSRVNSQAANTVLGAVNDRSIDITSKSNQTYISLTYVLGMPGFFGPKDTSRFYAGLSLADAITGSEYKFDDKTQPYTAAAVNTKTAVAGGTDAVQTNSYGAANYFRLAAMAAHSFVFTPLADTSLGFKPTVNLNFSMDGNNAYFSSAGTAVLKSSTAYTQTLDAAFAYDPTTNYTRTTTAYNGAPASTTNIGTAFRLPTFFKLRPTGWPLGFMAGATPAVSFSWSIATTAATDTTTTTDNYVANVLTTTTTTLAKAAATTSTTLATTTSENHAFGVFLPFQGGMHADISLNGSDVLIFDNLTLQLYVPLK